MVYNKHFKYGESEILKIHRIFQWSLKRLLYRSARSNVFTYEDLNTFLIEVSLNNQTLCALGSDTKNMAALTPGHFLTGRLLIPMPSIIENKIAMSEKFILKFMQPKQSYIM